METAFGEIEGILREQIREAELDHEAFERPLKVCVLTKCRATCCHDGVYLSDGELAVLDGVVRSEGFAGRNAEECFERREQRWKTSVVAAEADQLGEGFPAHFPKTRCVFLDGEHKCQLQLASMAAGKSPWFWKPISCWMHPLLLRPLVRGGRPRLTLARQDDDPVARPGYPGFSSFTPCGMPQEGAGPAWQALRGELELLGRIGGRDLVGELSGRGADADEQAGC